MRKLFISTSVAFALGLTGCGGGETIEDINNSTEVQTPVSRIVFDPASGELNIPNDLLMLPGDDGFFDYTLNIPVEDTEDFGDPQNALNILDGWSTDHPFVIEVNTASGVAIDASTLSAGIHLYQATLGLDQSDADCAQIPIPSAGCKVGDKLTYDVDYKLALVDDDTISVIPLKPLAAAKGHMLVMTDDLKDTSGKAVQGSTTWDLVRQDPSVNPLSSEDQLTLQNLVNSFIVPLERDAGLSRDNITYAAAFTTQSTDYVSQVQKQLMAAKFAATAAAGTPSPMIVGTSAAGAQNAMEALKLVNDTTLEYAVSQGIAALPSSGFEDFITLVNNTDFSALKTCSGLLGTSAGLMAEAWGSVNEFAVGVSNGLLAQVGPFCSAKRYSASITLPYYLGVPSMENPMAPVNSFWTAACDSGVVLAGAPADVLGAAEAGPNDAACSQIGLRDLRVAGQKIDSARNVTRFSPLVQPTIAENTLDVQITVPDPIVAGALNRPLVMPENGWPVAILVHGITGTKEQMMAISGTLSLHGIATIAIDHPLHGGRGFDVNMDGTDDINASTVSPTHYMNLASLPTARDNLRQSVADLLGLRLGLNAFVDGSADQGINLDTSSVSVMGVSLGAITGANFAAVANSPTGNPQIDALFGIDAASLESPAGGIPSFLMASPDFGPLIKALLLRESSPEFVAFLTAQFGSTDLDEATLRQAATLFFDNLTAEQLAAVNAVFAQFTFAAQTILDSGDPINYAAILGATTPVHMMTVVGDGADNLPDQVNPVTVSPAVPLAGQNPLAQAIGLSQVVSTVSSNSGTVSGQVRFNSGEHASSLNPASSAAVTTEMQLEVGGFIKSKATVLPITDESVVAN